MSLKEIITYPDFEKVQLVVGTIVACKDNIKAKKAAYHLTIDFGPFGLKESSAQLTHKYFKEELINRQIVAVLNFPPKNIAGVNSEVLILGALSPSGVTLLRPDFLVENGSSIA